LAGGRDNWTKRQKTAKLWLHKQVYINGVLEEIGKGCYTDTEKVRLQGKTGCEIIWL
jgi:hypothetical protein